MVLTAPTIVSWWFCGEDVVGGRETEVFRQFLLLLLLLVLYLHHFFHLRRLWLNSCANGICDDVELTAFLGLGTATSRTGTFLLLKLQNLVRSGKGGDLCLSLFGK